MLALRLYGAGDIRLEEVPIPEIQSDEILVKTEAAAICGTDVRMWQNGISNVNESNPLILGHEFSGKIVDVGNKVNFYERGMQVVLQPNIGCGICNRCVDGKFHLCNKYSAFGINMDGAFAEYVKIPAEAIVRGNLMVKPDNITPGEASLIEPLSCAYNGFLKCFVGLGEYALVVGAGPIGFCHAMILNAGGAKVLMNDISASRLSDVKLKLPFVETYQGNDLCGFVTKWTKGNGLDIAITACPVPAIQGEVLSLMNYGGRVNYFGGIPANLQPVPINTNLIHYHELYVTGSTRSSIAQFRKTLELVSLGFLNVGLMITNTYNIKDILTAFNNVKEAKGIKHVIEF